MKSTDFIKLHHFRTGEPCYVLPSFIRCVQSIPESPGIDQHTAISTSDTTHIRILVHETSAEIMELIDAATTTAELILSNTPSSRERALALTNLEQAVFWANAAIARNEQES